MKLLLNTNLIPMFNGTYETEWEITEYNEEGTEEVDVDYDFQDFMKSIAEAYHGHEEQILKSLKAPFVKSIHFTGNTFSPREYNFSTDQLDFEVEINRAGLLRELKKLEDNAEFQEFLHEHFTSYDGFMSFTPNNYSDLAHEIKSQGDEEYQAISALIRFLAGEGLKDINGDVWEDWQGNGYEGLDYTTKPYEK